MPSQPVPDSLPARLLVKAELLSDSMFEKRRALRKSAGEALKSAELSPEDRKQQYIDMISSPSLLMNSLAGAAIIGRDGRLRISTQMVEAFKGLSSK